MMITSRNTFFIAFILYSATCSACTPAQQRSNRKLQEVITPSTSEDAPLLSSSTENSEIEIDFNEENTTTNDESPYSNDVGVNLNDSNITEDNIEDIPLFGTLPVNYNTTMMSILKTTEPTTDQPDTSIMVSHGIYDLGQKILYKLLSDNGKHDVKSEVISPLSIAGCIYLLYLGSAGQTGKELASLLGLNKAASTNQKEIHLQFGRLLEEITTDQEMNNDDKEYPEYIEDRVHEISVANAIFMNNIFKLRPQYVNAVQDVYKSEVMPMDFATRGSEAKTYIDGWVNNKTHGKIPTILETPPSAATQAIVVSALYFKALWWEELGVQMVVKQPFYPNGDDHEPISVDTILFASELLPYYESKALNCRIIGFRYQKQLSTMYIVQPLKSNRQAIVDFQTKLTAVVLESLIKNMTYAHFSSLTFPKFHLQNEADLKLIFRQLGVHSLFTNANLSPITPNRYHKLTTNETNDLDYLDIVRRHSAYYSPSVAISQIHHKVDLVVNERGTEGGAATAAVVDRISARYMKVNTPFLFVIRQDNTKLPLFYGTVFEPEQD